MKLVHKPTEIEAVHWQGDLQDVAHLAVGDVELAKDASGVLWVTTYDTRTSVFPVALGHWLVRDSTGRLASMPGIELNRLYAWPISA